ncbi:hypothetical protein KMT30_39310 [Streptomyces sp. IBSBF 2953]|uniref:hypothetical protein n=1 Tax=Streptomyces TaxID=1883 RepID=UPI002119EC27|nr:hypothetical protein [Streptomyces scabiei]MCQ9184978.1 hypothetical protein [Streptomyces hayashii]MDX3118135.1 hypothetical protein [Streptomyces scabiei]
MSGRQDCEWQAMTPADFDREAPLRLNVGTGPTPVPAETDEYGTLPLFGHEPPTRQPARRAKDRPVTGVQDELF